MLTGIPSTVLAGLFIFSLCVWGVYFAWKSTGKIKKSYRTRVVVCSLVVALIGLTSPLYWGVITNPKETNEPKPFMKQTKVENLSGYPKYSLLVECGTKNIPVSVDVLINTSAEYSGVDFGFNVPNQKVYSHSSVEAYMGLSWTKASQLYSLTIQFPTVTQSSSLYIYFESDKPLDIVSAQFAGKTFHPVNGYLKPE